MRCLYPQEKIANAISFQLQEYVAQDCIYDRLKGMIVAFTRAMAFAKKSPRTKTNVYIA